MIGITTFDQLDAAIAKAGGKPTVLEALWEGDTNGWFIGLYLYAEKGLFFGKRRSRHTLGYIALAPDMPVVANGKWAAAVLARAFGDQAVEKYRIVFYFPSEVHPDDSCPTWADRHLAIRCADCGKLIMQTDSPYLPHDICYHCHLKQTYHNKIKNDEPCRNEVTVYLSKNGGQEVVGNYAMFDELGIAPLISMQVTRQLKGSAVEIAVLTRTDILKLEQKIHKALTRKLKKYEQPDTSVQASAKMRRLAYNGVMYNLVDTAHHQHRSIIDLIDSLAIAQRALSGHYVYQICFKRGLTHRDDHLLRFVQYAHGGSVDFGQLQTHYEKLLDLHQLNGTVQRLVTMGCLKIMHGRVLISRLGKYAVR